VTSMALATAGPKWTILGSHRAWLLQQAEDLLSLKSEASIVSVDFFQPLAFKASLRHHA
jgi:hypothetical protein